MLTHTSHLTLRALGVLAVGALVLALASAASADTGSSLSNYGVVSGNPFKARPDLNLARVQNVKLVNTRAGYAKLTVTLPRPATCPAHGACLVSAALVSDTLDWERRVPEEFSWDRKTVKVTGKRYRVTLSLAGAIFGGAELIKLRSHPLGVKGYTKHVTTGSTDVMLLVQPRKRGRDLVDHATVVRPWSANAHADFELPDAPLKRGDFQLCSTHTTFDKVGGFNSSSWGCSEDVHFEVLHPTKTGMRVRVSWWAMPASVKGGGDTRDVYELRYVPTGRLVFSGTVIR